MKRSKILNLSLIITSLVGYLEWGGGNEMFLFQGEIEIILKFISNPSEVIHPFTLLPLLGQLLLLITLFQKNPSKIITFLGMAGVGLLLLFMFVIGLISLNFNVLASTIPFLVIAILTINYHRKH